jgi:hypothetical protein
MTTIDEDTDDTQDEKDTSGLTPDEYAEHIANLTANAFQSTRLFEVVEVKAGVGQVHLLGRVKSADETIFLDKVITPVLKAIEASHECEGHICKQYLRKNGKTKYAWTVSFAANNLQSASRAICDSISSVAAKRELLEMPLSGQPTPKGAVGGSGRRGAAPLR